MNTGDRDDVARPAERGQSVSVADDWTNLRQALREAGVEGVDDLGRFVDSPEHFRPSQFDERAAMPVLLANLPSLNDPDAVAAVAGHLKRPWARPHAYPALHAAFLKWARSHPTLGWSLGEAMANAAQHEQLQDLIELAENEAYGSARQMIVLSLGRFGSDPSVPSALIRLSADPDVSLHAMSALRRSLGNEDALPHLRSLEQSHPSERVRQQARREIKKAEKAMS